MRDVRDRRDLGCLGLMVLAYGLVLAPVVHAVEGHAGGLELPAAAQGWLDHQRSDLEHGHEHGHGHSHEHGKGQPHRHLTGSVEHLQAVAVASAAVLAPVAWWVPLRAEEPRSPQRASVAPLRPTAMPQGP